MENFYKLSENTQNFYKQIIFSTFTRRTKIFEFKFKQVILSTNHHRINWTRYHETRIELFLWNIACWQLLFINLEKIFGICW